MYKPLSKWTISDLLEDDKSFVLEYAEEDDTVQTIIQKLRNRNITSLPVRDSKSKKFTGIIDVLDIVTFCCIKYATTHDNAFESYQQMETFAKTKAKVLLDLSRRNSWLVLSETRPLADLVALLSNPHVHRVGIMNKHHDVIGLVSQYKMMQFFWKYKEFLEPNLRGILHSKVELWTHVHSQALITISQYASVFDGFQTIWDKEVSGLAVVNEEGVLVANLSASDIKRCRFYPVIGQMAKDLHQPIKNFLRIPSQNEEKLKKKHHVPFYVHKHETMETVLEMIVTQHIHRLFVVDAKMRPIAVISLCDILRRFWESAINA